MARSNRILLVSELGAGLGHIAPLFAVAQSIATDKDNASRVEFTVASPDSVGIARSFPDIDHELINSPVSPPVVHLKSHTASYAEVLTTFGFSRPAHLRASMRAWDDLINLTKPDLIVADHSPSVCLAARGRIPVVQTGTGFTLPPAFLPQFPSLLRESAAPAVQKQTLLAINEILDERNSKPYERLPELLDTEYRAIFSLPHLDPYSGIRREDLLGTYHKGLVSSDPPREPRVFVYAGSGMRDLDAIVQSISDRDIEVEAYFGNADTVAARFLKNRGMKVHDQPPELSDVLARSSLVISQGGAGLSNAALIVGRPHIVYPNHAESGITAARLVDLKLGINIEQNPGECVPEAVEQIFSDPEYAGNAQDEAMKIADSGKFADGLSVVANRVLELIG